MNYLNLHTDFFRSKAFIGADPVERGTWLCLMAWCATQENGGVIKDSESWTDRTWQQLCGITLSEVETISSLYGFVDGNLVVSNYPIEKEAEVKAKREAGKKGGRPKKIASTQPLVNKDFKPHGSIMLKANDNHQAETVKTERNGREGKGMERKGISPAFPQVEEFVSYCVMKLEELNPEWTKGRATKAARLKYETYREAGWKDGNGKAIKNWKTKALNSLKFEKPWSYGTDEQDKPAQERRSAV